MASRCSSNPARQNDLDIRYWAMLRIVHNSAHRAENRGEYTLAAHSDATTNHKICLRKKSSMAHPSATSTTGAVVRDRVQLLRSYLIGKLRFGWLTTEEEEKALRWSVRNCSACRTGAAAEKSIAGRHQRNQREDESHRCQQHCSAFSQQLMLQSDMASPA